MTATETAFQDIAITSAKPTKQQPYKKYFLIEYMLSDNPTRAWEAHFQRAFASSQHVESIKGRCVLMKFPAEQVEERFLVEIKEQFVGAIHAANAAYRNDGELQRLAEESRQSEATREAKRFDTIADIRNKQFPQPEVLRFAIAYSVRSDPFTLPCEGRVAAAAAGRGPSPSRNPTTDCEMRY